MIDFIPLLDVILINLIAPHFLFFVLLKLLSASNDHVPHFFYLFSDLVFNAMLFINELPPFRNSLSRGAHTAFTLPFDHVFEYGCKIFGGKLL